MDLTQVVGPGTVSYTHLRAHETRHDLVCRLLLEKKNFSLLVPSLGSCKQDLLTGFIMTITGSLTHRVELGQIIWPWGSDNIDKQVRKRCTYTLFPASEGFRMCEGRPNRG